MIAVPWRASPVEWPSNGGDLAQLVNPGLEGFNFLRLLMGLAHQGSNFGLAVLPADRDAG